MEPPKQVATPKPKAVWTIIESFFNSYKGHYWRSFFFFNLWTTSKKIRRHSISHRFTGLWLVKNSNGSDFGPVTRVQQLPLFFFSQTRVAKPEAAFPGSLNASSSLLAQFSNSPQKLCSRPEPDTVRRPRPSLTQSCLFLMEQQESQLFTKTVNELRKNKIKTDPDCSSRGICTTQI